MQAISSGKSNPNSFRVDINSEKPELTAEQTRDYNKAIALINKHVNNSAQRQQFLHVLRDNPEVAVKFIQDIEQEQAIAIIDKIQKHPADRYFAIEKIKADPAYASQIITLYEAEQASICTIS